MDKYGLIGYPLGHSFSKGFFTEKFAREGIDARYDNYEIESVAKLRDIVTGNPELRGLNCTIPHKQAVIGELDNLSEGAKKIGAVNVIKIRRNEDGSIYLARPWRDYGLCRFENCTYGPHISPLGFDKWNDTDRDRTARFYETPAVEGRVKWVKK